MKWKNLLASTTFLAAITLAGCGSEESNTNGKENQYTVGISQFVEHPSLDEATKGFKKALEDSGLSVKYDEQNKQTADKTNAGRPVPPSMIFVPATAGLMLAKEVIFDLIKGEK